MKIINFYLVKLMEILDLMKMVYLVIEVIYLKNKKNNILEY